MESGRKRAGSDPIVWYRILQNVWLDVRRSREEKDKDIRSGEWNDGHCDCGSQSFRFTVLPILEQPPCDVVAMSSRMGLEGRPHADSAIMRSLNKVFTDPRII